MRASFIVAVATSVPLLFFVGASVAAPAEQPVALSAADYAFVGQTVLGNQFQVDTGQLGADRATDMKVKAYAQEMVPSHQEVERKLLDILQRKGITQPPLSLLASSYVDMVEALRNDMGIAFDRDYVRQQMNYQTGNDALYRWEIANGSDPELKAFATDVLVKIDQHFDMVKALAHVD